MKAVRARQAAESEAGKHRTGRPALFVANHSVVAASVGMERTRWLEVVTKFLY
jgi:hypothetical protein